MGDQDRFQQDVMRSLGRIEGTLDYLVAKNGEQDVRTGMLEGRVNTLENADSRRKGAVAAISAMVSALVALVVAVVKTWL